MKILIASVYNRASVEKWHQIQLRYLPNTTCDYDFCVYLNDKPVDLPNTKIIHVDPRPDECRMEHMRGVRGIVEHFKNNPQYDYCLMLDSDAFPIQKGWENILISNMKNTNIAAAVRFENLDTFPHPCIFFFNRKGIDKFEFHFDQMTNIVNFRFEEFNIRVKEGYFPLIKTNVYSPHPILSVVYYHLFYHHGAGSRNFYSRSTHINKYYHYLTEQDNVRISNKLYDEVRNNKSFIKSLISEPSSFKDNKMFI